MFNTQIPGDHCRAWVFTGLLALLLACRETGQIDAASAANREPMAFSVYVLSRGRGVPADTRQRLQATRDYLRALQDSRQMHIVIHEERIGLEGEHRLCAVFTDADAATRALEHVRDLTAGAELLNIVVEPCPRNFKSP